MTTPTLDPFVPPGSAQRATTPDGELFVWEPYPGIVLEKARGVMSLPLAEFLATFFQQLLQPGSRYLIFADFEQLQSYTRDARELQINFALGHLDAFEAVHVLIASKYIALGIGAYKHDIGDQRVYTYAERASLVRSYEEAVRALLH
jgi:hypothetical protein